MLDHFVFVLAYNLARPGTLERGVYGRTMSRLAMFGALASVPFVALGGLYAGWWPLNVMFTLLVVTATAYLVERGGKLHLAAAGVVFLVGGSSVEYWWPAVAFGLAVWSYTRRPSWAAAAVAVLACAALWFVNRNLWALAALPVLFLASRVDVSVPRLRSQEVALGVKERHQSSLGLQPAELCQHSVLRRDEGDRRRRARPHGPAARRRSLRR